MKKLTEIETIITEEEYIIKSICDIGKYRVKRKF